MTHKARAAWIHFVVIDQERCVSQTPVMSIRT
jgi:hypothetical protein